MKREQDLNQEKTRSDKLAACIIAASVLLCIVVSFLGFLKNREALRDAAQTAAQAAAQVGKAPLRIGEDKQSEASPGQAQLSDPLLVLVNDWTPLPEDWQVTPRMVDDEQVDLRMYEDLMAMFDAAAEDEVWFWVASGYRSVEEQEVILDRAVGENVEQGMTEGEAEREALRTIARPRYSEHHTGLAVDLNDVSDDFEETEAYAWLSEHAADYGFVQRYKKEKMEYTGIDNESWHYRYVGKKHAKEMERLDMCLEEYVAYLKKRSY